MRCYSNNRYDIKNFFPALEKSYFPINLLIISADYEDAPLTPRGEAAQGGIPLDPPRLFPFVLKYLRRPLEDYRDMEAALTAGADT